MTVDQPICNIKIIGRGTAKLTRTESDRRDGERYASWRCSWRIDDIAPAQGWIYQTAILKRRRHEITQRWNYDKGSVETTEDAVYESSDYTSGATLENSKSLQRGPDGALFLSSSDTQEGTLYVVFVKEDGPCVLLLTFNTGGGRTSPTEDTMEGNPGQSVSFSISAIPDDGYVFWKWTSPQGGIADSSSSGTTITGTVPYSGMAQITATASFIYDGPPKPPYPPPEPPEPGVKHVVSIAADPESGGIVDGGGEYDDGATCTLTAERNIGFELMSLVNSEDGITILPPNPPQCFGKTITHSFAVTKDSSWIANFRECTNAILRGKSGDILRGQGGNVLRDW